MAVTIRLSKNIQSLENGLVRFQFERIAVKSVVIML